MIHFDIIFYVLNLDPSCFLSQLLEEPLPKRGIPGDMSLGQNIAELRKWRDLSQRDFASKLGVSQSHVARWETDRSQPRNKTLEQIAGVLDVTVEEILSGGQNSLESALNIKDAELLALLREIQNLSDKELDALKTVIRGLLARSRVELSLKA